MKIIPIQRTRSVLASTGLLTLVVAAAGLSVAWSGHRHYQLGGGYIGSGAGLVYNALYIPLDPTGKQAALRLQFPSWGPDMAQLVAAFGADAASDGVGEAEMISPNAFKWSLVTYGVKQGNPPTIQMILVSRGTGTFASADTLNVKYTMAVYAATADADGDGFPDTGQTPAMTFPDLTGTAKRVPLP